MGSCFGFFPWCNWVISSESIPWSQAFRFGSGVFEFCRRANSHPCIHVDEGHDVQSATDLKQNESNVSVEGCHIIAWEIEQCQMFFKINNSKAWYAAMVDRFQYWAVYSCFTTMSDSKSPGGAMVEKVLFVISEWTEGWKQFTCMGGLSTKGPMWLFWMHAFIWQIPLEHRRHLLILESLIVLIWGWNYDLIATKFSVE